MLCSTIPYSTKTPFLPRDSQSCYFSSVIARSPSPLQTSHIILPLRRFRSCQHQGQHQTTRFSRKSSLCHSQLAFVCSRVGYKREQNRGKGKIPARQFTLPAFAIRNCRVSSRVKLSSLRVSFRSLQQKIRKKEEVMSHPHSHSQPHKQRCFFVARPSIRSEIQPSSKMKERRNIYLARDPGKLANCQRK